MKKQQQDQYPKTRLIKNRKLIHFQLNDLEPKACSKVYVQPAGRFSASVVLRIVELNDIGFNALNAILSVQ